ncbi:helix-turn-helix transcriptional regulator [Peribacillus sp. JNUCC 23]
MDKKLIGNRLIKLRGDKSREEVASSVDISVSALQMYENAQRIPRDEIKVRLANYYKTNVQALFFNDNTHKVCGDKNTA